MNKESWFIVFIASIIALIVGLLGLIIKLTVPALIIMVLMKCFWSAYTLSWLATILIPLLIGGTAWVICVILGAITHMLGH